MCTTNNMFCRTCVIVKQIQSNPDWFGNNHFFNNGTLFCLSILDKCDFSCSHQRTNEIQPWEIRDLLLFLTYLSYLFLDLTYREGLSVFPKGWYFQKLSIECCGTHPQFPRITFYNCIVQYFTIYIHFQTLSIQMVHERYGVGHLHAEYVRSRSHSIETKISGWSS